MSIEISPNESLARARACMTAPGAPRGARREGHQNGGGSRPLAARIVRPSAAAAAPQQPAPQLERDYNPTARPTGARTDGVAQPGPLLADVDQRMAKTWAEVGRFWAGLQPN